MKKGLEEELVVQAFKGTDTRLKLLEDKIEKQREEIEDLKTLNDLFDKKFQAINVALDKYFSAMRNPDDDFLGEYKYGQESNE